MTAGVSIRPGRVDEAGTVLALWVEAGSAPSVTDSVERVRAVIERGDTWLLVAEEDGPPAADLSGAAGYEHQVAAGRFTKTG